MASSAIIPFLAIVVAGVVAALIGRSSTRRLLTQHDRDRRVASVSALIGAARRASKWNTLSAPEKDHAEHLFHDADVSLRLLPLAGAMMTADWAAHEIAEMKKNSVSFSFQAEQSLIEFRDRLVEWQAKPSRAKKLFKADLDLWAYESNQEDQSLVEKQQEWAKRQVATETGPTSSLPPAASTPDRAAAETDAAAAVSATSQTATTPTPALPGREDNARTAGDVAVTAPAQAASERSNDEAEERQRTYSWHASSPSQGARSETAIAATSGLSTSQSTTPSVPLASPAAGAQSMRPASGLLDSQDHGGSTPSPVSANTVRQRILPDRGDADLR